VLLEDVAAGSVVECTEKEAEEGTEHGCELGGRWGMGARDMKRFRGPEAPLTREADTLVNQLNGWPVGQKRCSS
jgi:hypothetical protein